MTQKDLAALVRQGLSALDEDDVRTARRLFGEAARQEATPLVRSCLGYCLAREERNLKKAFALCREALREEPANPLLHLNLGRIYLLDGNKPLAIRAFRKGLKFGRHQRLLDEMARLGMRRPLFFPSLGRRHLLNRSCGFLFSRLGLRGLIHLPEKFREHHR